MLSLFQKALRSFYHVLLCCTFTLICFTEIQSTGRRNDPPNGQRDNFGPKAHTQPLCCQNLFPSPTLLSLLTRGSSLKPVSAIKCFAFRATAPNKVSEQIQRDLSRAGGHLAGQRGRLSTKLMFSDVFGVVCLKLKPPVPKGLVQWPLTKCDRKKACTKQTNKGKALWRNKCTAIVPLATGTLHISLHPGCCGQYTELIMP